MVQRRRPSWTRGRHTLRTTRVALTLTALLVVGATTNAGVTRAQDMATPTTSMATGVPTVSVSGHGQVNVPPDTASVSIGIDVIQPTLAEAQVQATAQATTVIEALKAAGIADEDIQTASFSVTILRDYSENADPTQITGFEIMNQLQLTVRDTDRLGDLLDKAVNAGANSINGVTFSVDDQTAAAREARKLAVADARTKAEELAAAVGLSLGPVISIAEGTLAAPPLPYTGGESDMVMQKSAVPVESGSSTIAVDVSMIFELR